MSSVPKNEKKDQLLGFLTRMNKQSDFVAALMYGPRVCGYADEQSNLYALVVLERSKLSIKTKSGSFGDIQISILYVDRRTFERDVEEDWLGGLLAENLITPYEVLLNRGYLWEKEIETKKRIVIETLKNLVSEYPELSHELLLNSKYFLLEVINRKSSLFPAAGFRFLNIERSVSGKHNREMMMRGFEESIDLIGLRRIQLASNIDYVKIPKEFIEKSKRKHPKMANLFENARKGALRHLVTLFTRNREFLDEERRLYEENVSGKDSLWNNPLSKLEDPERHVFLPSALGLSPLSERVTMRDFVTLFYDENVSLLKIQKLGGVLNSVYLLKIRKDSEIQHIVAKLFKDWQGWKWFPLSIWTFGTHGFSVSGKSRLEKEYAFNNYLAREGVNVPKILYVSHKERLIFEEFVEGANCIQLIKQIRTNDDSIESLDLIRSTGRELAKIHRTGLVLGDCKPENIIVDSSGKIYFVDLEQSEKGGDQTWDLAEYLYFAGHYVSLDKTDSIRLVTQSFVAGYLEGGGKKRNVRGVSSPRYVRVFGLLTPPHIMLVISGACKETLENINI